MKQPTGLGHLTRAQGQRHFYVAMACGILSKRTSQILPFAGSQVPGLVRSAFSQNKLNQAQDDALSKSEFGLAIARKTQDGNDLTVGDELIPNEKGSHEMVMEDW